MVGSCCAPSGSVLLAPLVGVAVVGCGGAAAVAAAVGAFAGGAGRCWCCCCCLPSPPLAPCAIYGRVSLPPRFDLLQVRSHSSPIGPQRHTALWPSTVYTRWSYFFDHSQSGPACPSEQQVQLRISGCLSRGMCLPERPLNPMLPRPQSPRPQSLYVPGQIARSRATADNHKKLSL